MPSSVLGAGLEVEGKCGNVHAFPHLISAKKEKKGGVCVCVCKKLVRKQREKIVPFRDLTLTIHCRRARSAQFVSA